jgi:hypothetical protein
MEINNLIKSISHICEKASDNITLYMNIKNLLQNINSDILLDEFKNYNFISESIHNNNMKLNTNNIYTKKCVCKSELFDLYLIEWTKNSFTKIHDHPSKGCIVKVLSGNLYEETFDNCLYFLQMCDLKKNDIGYKISNKVLHRIICKENAMSLHVYIPGGFNATIF